MGMKGPEPSPIFLEEASNYFRLITMEKSTAKTIIIPRNIFQVPLK